MRTAKVMMPLTILALIGRPGMAQDEPGYPIEQFLGVTAFTEVVVAPDGRHVAFITRSDDFEEDRRETAIWRLDLDRNGGVTGLTRLTFTPGSYSGISWSSDGRYLAFLSDRGEEKSQQLYVLPLRGGEAVQLTDSKMFSDGVAGYDWLPERGEVVFAAPGPTSDEEKTAYDEFYGDVVRYASEKQYTTFWRMAADGPDSFSPTEIATVEMTVSNVDVSPNGKTIAFLSGAPSEPERFSNSFADYEVFVLPTEGGELRQLTHNFVNENNIEWRRDGAGLFAMGGGYPNETRSRWTQGRLFSISMDGAVDVVARDFEGELGSPYGRGSFVQLPDRSVLTSGIEGVRANAYRVNTSRGSVEAISDFQGAVSNVSASADGKIIAFVLVTHNSFPELYVASGIDDIQDALRSTDFNGDIAALPMPEVQAIRWSNGEGDEIDGILYWPPGQRGASDLPVVVDIHGGPWSARTENLGPFGFAYYPALLASRGYLVLEPNYRGGAGRGDEFLHAIEGYSCSRPATDVLTGVDHIVEQGWADPDRMGVMGYSYGGLMTNCIITKTDRFRVAASGAGLWNDISYFGTADNFTQNDVRNLGTAPWENFENYWEESPISAAGNIRTPTLITIGGADRRVPTTQGMELYRALVRLGVPAELLIFPGEPHGFRTPSHKLTKVRAEIRWLDRHLLRDEATEE